MTVGASWVAHGHDEVAFLDAFLGDFQEMLRHVRHVVLREFGALAVFAHIGAVEAIVAGVARPHPVVGVATKFAHASWRRVHQAHVLDFQLLDQVELESTVVARHRAAVADVFFAFGDQVLFIFFDAVDACLAAQLGHFRGDDLVADVGHFLGDENAAARSRRHFIGHGLGQETVRQQVVLRGRIDRHAVVDAVVVGRDQAHRRDEGGRAAAQADNRAARKFGQLGQGGRVQFQTCRFQLLGYLWQLLRHPHAFVGVGDGAEDGKRE